MTATTTGSRRHFWAQTPVTAPQHDEIRRAWTDPATWELWDRGLTRPTHQPELRRRQTRRDRGPVRADCNLHSHRSRDDRAFVRIAFRLPKAQLVLTRRFADDRLQVQHEVQFSGPLSPLYALILGGGFRAKIGPPLDALLQQAACRAR